MIKRVIGILLCLTLILIPGFSRGLVPRSETKEGHAL